MFLVVKEVMMTPFSARRAWSIDREGERDFEKSPLFLGLGVVWRSVA